MGGLAPPGTMTTSALPRSGPWRRSGAAESVEVAVVGAGQAGLAVSYELTRASVEHVVLERGRVGQAWRDRWDSFCLVIPNWTVQLTGGRYQGLEPDGFMPRDDIVAHLDNYARCFGAPVREGVAVSRLGPGKHGSFQLSTSSGQLLASQVVIATGGYQRPHRPAAAAGLPDGLHVIDAGGYAHPGSLPAGAVLVVGSGQTGCQLAEELAEAGRKVHLACGRAPWIPRRIEGRDTIAWLAEAGYFEDTLADLPAPQTRLGANAQASGRRGGHDLNYRTLHALGVALHGHFTGIDEGAVRFAPDLARSVAFGDARYAGLCAFITAACARRGMRPPQMPPPPPFTPGAPRRLRISDLGAVVFASGFRPDYARWVAFAEAFGDLGFPVQHDGSSPVVAGLHFIGIPFQRKRKSATLLGVAEDAAVLAETITASRRPRSGHRRVLVPGPSWVGNHVR
jgi:putative flavoprotein involved in K+ transport